MKELSKHGVAVNRDGIKALLYLEHKEEVTDEIIVEKQVSFIADKANNKDLDDKRG